MSGVGEGSGGGAEHPLALALAAQAKRWPRPETSPGALAPGFATLRDVFADGPLVERMLAAQARFTPDLDRKGQAAYLMTAHAGAVGLIAASAFVGFGLVPRLGPDEIALRVEIPGPEDQEERTAFRLLSRRFATDGMGAGASADAEPVADRDALCDRLRLELEAHFAPVVRSLHAATGLPRSALWRLAGDSVAGWFLEAGRRFRREAEAKAEALRVLKRPGSPLRNREMHYFDVALADPARPERIMLTRSFRARGGCCRWYTTAGGKLCTTCVLRSEEDRRAAIENGIRRRLGLADPAASAAS